jgi:hypothetical protein
LNLPSYLKGAEDANEVTENKAPKKKGPDVEK